MFSSASGFEIATADSVERALIQLVSAPPDVLLVHGDLPQSQRLAVLERLGASRRPVVMCVTRAPAEREHRALLDAGLHSLVEVPEGFGETLDASGIYALRRAVRSAASARARGRDPRTIRASAPGTVPPVEPAREGDLVVPDAVRAIARQPGYRATRSSRPPTTGGPRRAPSTGAPRPVTGGPRRPPTTGGPRRPPTVDPRPAPLRPPGPATWGPPSHARTAPPSAPRTAPPSGPRTAPPSGPRTAPPSGPRTAPPRPRTLGPPGPRPPEPASASASGSPSTRSPFARQDAERSPPPRRPPPETRGPPSPAQRSRSAQGGVSPYAGPPRTRNPASVAPPGWSPGAHTQRGPSVLANLRPGSADHAVELVVIGSSTGGPSVLTQLFGRLPADMPPIVIAQHLLDGFSASLALQLDNVGRLVVREGFHGAPLTRGVAYIAPSGVHTRVIRARGSLALALEPGRPGDRHCPAIDVLFRSAAEVAGARSIGLIMTGMGSDGADGLLTLRRAGAVTLAQDEASSAVFGMAARAIERGAASLVASPTELAAVLAEAAQSRHRARTG